MLQLVSFFKKNQECRCSRDSWKGVINPVFWNLKYPLLVPVYSETKGLGMSLWRMKDSDFGDLSANHFNTDQKAPILSLACSSASFSIAAGTELTNHQSTVAIW